MVIVLHSRKMDGWSMKPTLARELAIGLIDGGPALMSSITLKCSTTVTAATVFWAASVSKPLNGPLREAEKRRKFLGSPN